MKCDIKNVRRKWNECFTTNIFMNILLSEITLDSEFMSKLIRHSLSIRVINYFEIKLSVWLWPFSLSPLYLFFYHCLTFFLSIIQIDSFAWQYSFFSYFSWVQFWKAFKCISKLESKEVKIFFSKKCKRERLENCSPTVSTTF